MEFSCLRPGRIQGGWWQASAAGLGGVGEPSKLTAVVILSSKETPRGIHSPGLGKFLASAFPFQGTGTMFKVNIQGTGATRLEVPVFGTEGFAGSMSCSL